MCFALKKGIMFRKCDVLNRGFSGYNSRWCDIVLPRLVTKDCAQEIAAFILFLGANDSNLPESKQHVPCNDYSKHMTSMLQYLNASTSASFNIDLH